MTPFICPYCSKPLSEVERNDRASSVFWFSRSGKQFAHTQCWLDDEIAKNVVPTLKPVPESRILKRLALRKIH
jgi:hypothetical protein